MVSFVYSIYYQSITVVVIFGSEVSIRNSVSRNNKWIQITFRL